MSETAAPSPATPPKPQQAMRTPILILVVAALLLCIVLAIVIVVLVVRPALPAGSTEGIPLEVTRGGAIAPTPGAGAPPPVIEIGDVSVRMATPLTLQIGEQSFPVQPAMPGDDGWAELSAVPGFAVWAYGSAVNYVLGLEGTPENQALLDGLADDAPILLRLSSGTELTFRVAQRQETAPGDAGLFTQSHPSLTLLLLGGETWPALFADFDAAMEPAPQPAEAVAEIGQQIQIGDIRITVEDGYALPEEGDVQPGTMIFLIEYTIQNTGTSALDSAAFTMELVDPQGGRYPHSPAIAAWGSYGPLEGAVAAGAEVQSSAGYLVPADLQGPALTWVFRPIPGSEVQASFNIPYEPPVVVAVPPEVDVTQAFLGEDDEILHVVAEITNPGSSSLTVDADDVFLSSSAGPGTLDVAAPPFPWTIAAGDSVEVELQFLRPDAASCIVTILGYTFEISGLP